MAKSSAEPAGHAASKSAAGSAARSASGISGRGQEILAELETLRDMLRGRIPSQ
jgi:hypothetical protein